MIDLWWRHKMNMKYSSLRLFFLKWSLGLLTCSIWILQNALLVYVCEMMIDIIKHSFIAKFNDIKPIAFSEFLEDLCKQVLFEFLQLYYCSSLSFLPWCWVVNSWVFFFPCIIVYLDWSLKIKAFCAMCISYFSF